MPDLVVYTTFDAPPEASAKIVDAGLDEYNASVAPLDDVAPLAYLTTLSFQAPDFYRKRGYAPIAQISGYPNGIVKYLMHKIDPQTS